MFNKTNLVIFIILTLSSTIRIWDLTKVPSALYWDEIDVGYQAYSILKTGRDYFENFLPIYFHSLADFRTPLLIYVTVPFIAFFGLNEWAVRLPPMIFGVSSIFLLYLVVKEIINKKIAVITTAIFAFSPWQIHYSRIAFEVTLMLSMFLLGLFGFFKGLKKANYLLLASVGLSLTPAVYSTAKLFVPLVLIALVILFLKDLKKMGRSILAINIFIYVIISIPIYSNNFFGGGGNRFFEVAIFTDPTIPKEVDRLRLEATLYSGNEKVPGLNSSIKEKLLFNKPFLNIDQISSNYLTSLSPEFLFIKGDQNLRHGSSVFGQFYRLEILTFVLGFIYLSLNRKKFGKYAVFIFIWFLLAPIASSLTRDGATHATRLFFLSPVVSIFIGFGVSYVYEKSKNSFKFLLPIYLIFWVFSILIFLNYYYTFYKVESARSFQYGFSQAAKKAFVLKSNYDQVVIDDSDSSSIMAFLFANKIEPKMFQSQIKYLSAKINDEIIADRIDNVYFPIPLKRDWWTTIKSHKLSGNSLIILSSQQAGSDDPKIVKDKFGNNAKLVGTINFPNKKPAFYVIEQVLRKD